MSPIKDRFDHSRYKALQQLDDLLVNTSRGEEYAEELAFVIDHFGDDIVPSNLETKLQSITTSFIFRSPAEKSTLSKVMASIIALSPAQYIAISEVCTVLKLIMVILATNAVMYQLTIVFLYVYIMWANRVMKGIAIVHCVMTMYVH